MKTINVYGPGCKNCTETMNRIEVASKAMGVEIKLEKVTDLQRIMEAGVMSTPGVSVDGRLVHSGSIPTEEKVRELLA